MEKMEQIKQYEEMARNINAIRMVKQGKYTRKDISQFVKIIPGIKNHFSILLQYNIVVKNIDRTYSFPKNPIYWENIKNVILSIRSKNAEYNRKYYAKKRKELEEPIKTVSSLEELISVYSFKEEDLVQYLKSTGNYKILKKEVKWEEL